MFEFLQGIIIILFETFCYCIFVDSFEKSTYAFRHRTIKRIIIIIPIAIAIAFFLNPYIYIKLIVVVILLCIITFIFNSFSIVKSLALSAVFEGLIISTEFIALAIYFAIVPNYDEYLGVIQHMIVIVSKALLFFLVLIVKMIIDKKNVSLLSDFDWVKLLCFPLFTMILGVTVFCKEGTIVDHDFVSVVWIVLCGLVGIDIFVFYYIIDIANKTRIIKEQELLNAQAQNQLKYYEKIKEEINNQRRITHEYKNQLTCIAALVNNNNIKDLKEYLSEITEDVRHDVDYIDSNNAMVDAIVNTKYKESVDLGITFIFNINDLSKLVIQSEDLVVLLSNTLNNAIEACNKCNNKIIKFKAVLEDDGLIISVKNTFNGNIVKKDEKIVSTKKDELNHGYGLKNISNIVNKYGGDFIIDYSETEFYVVIMIPQ